MNTSIHCLHTPISKRPKSNRCFQKQHNFRSGGGRWLKLYVLSLCWSRTASQCAKFWFSCHVLLILIYFWDRLSAAPSSKLLSCAFLSESYTRLSPHLRSVCFYLLIWIDFFGNLQGELLRGFDLNEHFCTLHIVSFNLKFQILFVI